jgi:PII-like signaling protein
MIYAGEEAEHHGRPLYLQLVRRLREAGAAGATSLRGICSPSAGGCPC